LITDPDGLAGLVGRLAGAQQIALDTEADSLHCYFEKLCLIQVSAGDEHLLVDPLAGLDLQPLFDVVCSKRLVFHGADYDLRLLRRVGKFDPVDLFDTMIAARLTGQPALGLAALVEKFFNVKLSKASQKANWAIRPLPPQMSEYALNDTRYLLEIAATLEADLHRLGRWEWFEESRDRMIASTRDLKERDDATVWRISGSSALSPRAQAVLRVLWFWRDAEARAWDRPPFHVIGNEDMIRVADQVTKGDTYSTPRMNSRRRKSFEVVLALALQIPDNEWPHIERVRRTRTSKDHLTRFEALKKKRDEVATGLGLDPSILAPRAALEAAAIDPQSNLLMNWQKKLMGVE
jgi:ribonuclease D